MLPIGEVYAKASQDVLYGKVYYDTGELKYEGSYVRLYGRMDVPCGIGTEYYKSGIIKKQGLFQRRGLVCGRVYYPSGKLKFEGCFREPSGYGPAYPTHGTLYAEDGAELYQGDVKCEFRGNAGYPKVVRPENYGSVE